MSHPSGENADEAPNPPLTASSWGAPPSAGQPPPSEGWGAAPPDAPRPGVIPLRPLSVGEILDGAITTMRRYPKPMLGLSFAVAAALSLVTFLVGVTELNTLSRVVTTPGTAPDLGPVIAALAGGLLLSVVAWLLQIVGTSVLVGMLAAVVGEAVLGREMTIAAAWASVRPRVWRLVGLSLVMSVLVWLGLAMCLVPGVVAITLWCMAPAVLVLERTSVLRSLGRAGSLVTGAFWRTLGVVVLLVVIYLLLNAALTAPFAVLGSVLSPSFEVGAGFAGPTVVQQALTALGGVLAGTVGYPFVGAAIVLLYVDRRMRCEGLARELSAQTATAERPR